MTYQYLSKSTKLTNYSVIPNDLFALGVSSTATVLYSKLLNRANLSIANGRVDAGLVEKKRAEKGRANIIYVKVPEGSLVGIGATDRKATVNGLQNKP